MASARVEQTLERFQEDERLTGDLTDTAATALLGWIEQQVIAADATADARGFEQQVAAIRTAARTAATAGEGDPAAATVVERAQAALTAAPNQSSTSVANSAAPPSAAPTSSPAEAPIASQPVAAAEPSASTDAAKNASGASLLPAGSSFWRTLRRRVRRWTHRKAS